MGTCGSSSSGQCWNGVCIAPANCGGKDTVGWAGQCIYPKRFSEISLLINGSPNSDPSSVLPLWADHFSNLGTSTNFFCQLPWSQSTSAVSLDGEVQIALSNDAHPFCIHTPLAIPFAYCNNLNAELENKGSLLLSLHPSWSPPRKVQTRYECPSTSPA